MSLLLIPNNVPLSDRPKLLFKHLNEAIDLEKDDRHIEAYIKYLSCINTITNTLLDDVIPNSNNNNNKWELRNDAIKRYLSCLTHSLERVKEIVSPVYSDKCNINAYKKSMHLDVSHQNSGGADNIPISPRLDVNTSPSKNIHGARFTVNPLFIPIKTPKQEADTRNHYLAQLHSVMSKELTSSITITPATPTHTNKLTMDLNLVRRLEENKDLAANKAKLLQKKEERLRKEVTFQNSHHLSIHQLTLEDRVKNFSNTNRWTLQYIRQLRDISDPIKPDTVKEFILGILRLTGHPICYVLSQYQLQVMTDIGVIYQQILQTGDFPTLLISVNNRRTSSRSFTSSLNSTPNTSLMQGLSDIANSCVGGGDVSCVENEGPLTGRLVFGNLENLRSLRNSLIPDKIKFTCEDILRILDFLEFIILRCYPELKPHTDLCRECLEQVFLHSLWVPLISLYRCQNVDKELALAKCMLLKLNTPPSLFDVIDKLTLNNDVTDLRAIPYQPVITELRSMHEKSSLSEKVSCLNRACRLVFQCASNNNNSANIDTSGLGCDDILPIICYVVARTCSPQLLSECELLGSLLPENALFGEIGYCISTIQTALSYLVHLETTSN